MQEPWIGITSTTLKKLGMGKGEAKEMAQSLRVPAAVLPEDLCLIPRTHKKAANCL
ncbi:hypothetical protein I79_026170 [Cricetulus griseus]|uniref:Uncharacterized protein n=1 Tax=Cricetulus griseus TaxID=10029 RepID=G3IQ73_CRIGR|nr:hypothetical protein I79_026170 [Cricetulus griseus]